jgi:putative tryptophan/tyrosine transport system substrate-binding protein
MRRRDFITLLGSAAAAWPLAARAQQRAKPVIGVLLSETLAPYAERVAALHRGLKEGGFVEGTNLVVEYRSAEGHDDRLLALATDLVRREVKLITGLNSTAAVLAAKAATATIPLVFAIGGDPVKNRLVESLSHPGGNVTGVSYMSNEIGPKQLGLLHDLLPNASSVAVLVNPTNPNAESDAQRLKDAARSLSLTVEVFAARNESDINTFFATLVREHIPAFMITADPLFLTRREQLLTLASYHTIPGMYTYRLYAETGGLISYGSVPTDLCREGGLYVSRILRGEKPDDLPVIQPTKFELVINLNTAKALGLTVPPTLLAIADEVIE